jgi:mono/diheme cytochrome c family protein
MQPASDFVLRISGCLLLLALPFRLASAAELKFTNADESRVEFERSVQPFLAKHCVECHGAKDPEGELDLTTLDPDMKASSSGSRWATIVEKLTKGEMPPKEKPRPDATGLAATIGWAQAESKRANRNFTRRAAYDGGARQHRWRAEAAATSITSATASPATARSPTCT